MPHTAIRILPKRHKSAKGTESTVTITSTTQLLLAFHRFANHVHEIGGPEWESQMCTMLDTAERGTLVSLQSGASMLPDAPLLLPEMRPPADETRPPADETRHAPWPTP